MIPTTRSVGALVMALAALSACPSAFGQLPSIAGTVFRDSDDDNAPSTGEGIAGVTLSIYQDNGDGLFNTAVDALVASEMTNVDGLYQFSDLQTGTKYFVQQPAQVVGGLNLREKVIQLSNLNPYSLIIDDFSDLQAVVAHPAKTVDVSALASGGILGGQRELHLEYLSGPAEATLRANPFGLSPVLQFDQSAGVLSVATVTWDGIDGDLSTSPALGLGGVDLTQAGLNTAFGFMFGVDAAGIGDQLTLKVFSGTDVSTAVVDLPQTGGAAHTLAIVPFSEFSNVGLLSSADAVQLVLGGQSPSTDAQLGAVGVIGPSVYNISVRKVTIIPEPTFQPLLVFGAAAMLARRRHRRASKHGIHSAKPC